MKTILPGGQVTGELPWPDLISGTLIGRYKRFLADVRLETGETVTAHCANSGAMLQCAEPGRTVYLSFHDNPKRKLRYTWELIDMPDSLVGVNTMVPNRLVAQSIQADRIPELTGYDRISREVKAGNSRLDLLLTKRSAPDCFIEIKNCTLVENGEALFPDAVTTRGRKHLTELRKLVKNGNRCVMFFLIQRMDAAVFKPADCIDPEYGDELRKAFANRVEIVVYDVSITLKSIAIGRRIPFVL
ncbi:MAG: DNA/RNA nuclease SfsA [Desulfobacteraceae bacterium]|nr:MAG: DNA/RNA nuclease SfsA [Desulfobacteraceae bacterium]